MDKETILKRKAELEATKDEFVAKLNAVTGGIYECDYWLATIEAEEAKKKVKKCKK
jgi:hypothetical protein